MKNVIMTLRSFELNQKQIRSGGRVCQDKSKIQPFARGKNCWCEIPRRLERKTKHLL